MNLLLSGVFVPEWWALLMLAGLVLTPVPFIAGLRYFLRRDYLATTFIIALAIHFVCFFITTLAGFKGLEPPDTFSSPLGYFAMFASYISGSKLLSYIVGTLVNFTAIFGIVRWIEKRLAARSELR